MHAHLQEMHVRIRGNAFRTLGGRKNEIRGCACYFFNFDGALTARCRASEARAAVPGGNHFGGSCKRFWRM